MLMLQSLLNNIYLFNLIGFVSLVIINIYVQDKI